MGLEKSWYSLQVKKSKCYFQDVFNHISFHTKTQILWYVSEKLHFYKTIAFICRSNCCQILAIRLHPSGILGIAKHIMQLTAGTLALVRLWPYGQWWGAVLTQNTPGKIASTKCSSESQHLQKHDGPVVTINACQAPDCTSSQAYLESLCTCKTSVKQRQSDCLT